MARNRAGSTRQSALNVGVLDRVRTFRGSLSIEPTFKFDAFYRFTLNSTSDVTLTLTNLQANADLRLIKREGNETLGLSRRRGRRNERITRAGAQALGAGDYFVQVSQDGVNTRYTLTLSPTATPPSGGGGGGGGGSGGGGGGDSGFPPAVAPSRDPGNLPSTAFDVGNLSGRSAYRESLNDSDLTDLYRFNITRSSRLTVSTVNVAGGTVETQLIYDINGNDLVDSGDIIQTADSITKSLGAGTYFVGVNRLTGAAGTNVTYELRFDETAITNLTPTADPPLGLGGATNLGALSGSSTIRQLVSTSDRTNPSLVGTFDSTDIYKFTITDEASNFSALLNTTQLTGDVTMSLIYDENGNGIANPGAVEGGFVVLGDFPGGVFTTGGTGGAALSINKTLGRGTYYLAVTQREVTDNTTYTVDLFANTVTGLSFVNDPVNDSIPTAFNLGTLNQNLTFKQYVGAPDDSDFYTFTIDQPRNIIIRYNGTSDLVGLRFGQDTNGNGFFDSVGDFPNGEVFRPSLTGDIVYSPLPPFFSTQTRFVEEIFAFTSPGIATDIYARLPAGTYTIEVNAQAIQTDLGDGLTRWGSSNILYNLSFIVEPPVT